jgi:hypothetical protein
VYCRWQGDRKPKAHIVTFSDDVVNCSTWNPDNVAFAGVDDFTASEFPPECAGHDDPPFVEITVPVGTIPFA